MPTKPGGTIGSLDYTADERQQLAKKLIFNVLFICIYIEQKISVLNYVKLNSHL